MTTIRLTADTSTKHISLLNRWFCHGKRVFTLLAVSFLAHALWSTRDDLLRLFSEVNPVLMALAVVLWMLSHTVSPLFSSSVLTALGSRLGYCRALELHVQYLPAKYLPGGIWHTIARVGVLHTQGISKRNLTALVFLENLMAPGVTLLVGGGLLYMFQPSGGTARQVAGLMAVLSLCGLVVGFSVLNQLILAKQMKVKARQYVSATAIVLTLWGVATASFLVFNEAFPHEYSSGSHLELAGIYLFSWGVGFLSIFAPQGIGVFEVVAANLIPPGHSFHAALIMFAMFRLVTFLGDMGAWIVWSLSKRSRAFLSGSREPKPLREHGL